MQREQIMLEETIKLSAIRLPKVKDLREQCQFGYYELAAFAGVRPCYISQLEHGVAIPAQEAAKILNALSHKLNFRFTHENVQGIRLKEQRRKSEIL